jgi:hypothetical protein
MMQRRELSYHQTQLRQSLRYGEASRVERKLGEVDKELFHPCDLTSRYSFLSFLSAYFSLPFFLD